MLNFVAPIATIPLIFNLFSTSLYSKSVFYFSIINLILFLFNFGYNSGAIQIIKSQKGQILKKNTFLELLQIKSLLVLISLILVLIISIIIKSYGLYFFLCSIWLLLNEQFIQLWIFQAFNSYKYFLYVNISNKFLTVLILLGLYFVKDVKDIYYPIILALPYFFSSTLVVIYIIKRFKGESILKNKIKISTLKVLFHIHLGNLGSFSYQQLTRILLGIYLPEDKIIIYDFSDKLFNVLKSPLGAISNSVGIKKMTSRSKNEINAYWKKILKIQVLIILCLGFFTFSLFNFSWFYHGIDVSEILLTLFGLSLSLPFVAMSNTFGVLFTPVYGGIKKFNRSIFIGGAIFLFITFLLIKLGLFNLLSLLATLLIVESFIGVSSFLYSKKIIHEI